MVRGWAEVGLPEDWAAKRVNARRLVKVGAAEEVAAGFADKFAATVLQPGGAGGAVDGVMFGGKVAGGGFCWGGGLDWPVCDAGLHGDRVTQTGIFLTGV